MKKLLCIFLLLLFGCAKWVEVGGLYNSDHNFSVEFPSGWMRVNTNEYLLATRDGFLLQNILIERLPIDKDLMHTKKKLKKGMLPQETAEIIIDNIASDPAILNFKVIENTPTKINGLNGFKAMFTYKNKDGLKIKSVYYGLLIDEWFYGMRYNAALRYYFEKDIETFEKVLRSFRVIKMT